MIEVVRFTVSSQAEITDKVLVDADRVLLRPYEMGNEIRIVLVLFKGQEEVAWFETWESAIKVSHLWEYTNE